MIKSLYAVPLALLFCFYILICPLFFQGGDTAELVNSSYHLFVPHPPGYPLYIWLQHFWLTITSFSTVFFRAGLLTILFSTCTLFLLFRPLKGQVLLLLIPVIFLGMNPDFVESSVLPDVFSLHGLFIAVILASFFYELRWKDFLIPFLFCFSFTNHHTTILLLPVLIYHFMEFKKVSWMGLLLGIVACILIYLSILGLNHSHPYSWGNVKDVSAIIDHFLRKDYGTFSLSPKGGNQGLNALLFLLQSIGPVLLLVVMVMIRGGKKLISDKKIWVTLSVLLLCFGFTLMGNIIPEQAGAEVLKRFHVMPLIVLVSLAVYMVNLIDFKKLDKIVLSVLLLCTCVFQGYYLKDFLNLRNDSIVEDYSRNLFEGALRNSPALINVTSDTAYFGIRYVSAFSGHISDQKVAVISPELFFYPWFNDKIRLQLPDFDIINKDKIYHLKRLNVDEDIIQPNLKKHNFLMTGNYKEGTWFKLVFLPLGRLMTEGTGTFFDTTGIENLKLHFRPTDVPVGSQHFTKGFFFYQYSHIHFARAFEAWTNKNLTVAQSEWEKAIEVVPYALPAKINLCRNFSKKYDFCQEENLQDLDGKTKGFY